MASAVRRAGGTFLRQPALPPGLPCMIAKACGLEKKKRSAPCKGCGLENNARRSGAPGSGAPGSGAGRGSSHTYSTQATVRLYA